MSGLYSGVHQDSYASVPKRIQVMRLFFNEEIDDEFFDPNSVRLDSLHWIEYKKEEPWGEGLFYVKNHKENEIRKAFYVGHCPYINRPPNCSWYHPTRNGFISNNEIKWWMRIYRTKELK